MRQECPGGCGRTYNLSAGYDRCALCRRKACRGAKRLTLPGSSERFAGHEERVRRYRERAALGLPLFGD
jgi:hypothetical protein